MFLHQRSCCNRAMMVFHCSTRAKVGHSDLGWKFCCKAMVFWDIRGAGWLYGPQSLLSLGSWFHPLILTRVRDNAALDPSWNAPATRAERMKSVSFHQDQSSDKVAQECHMHLTSAQIIVPFYGAWAGYWPHSPQNWRLMCKACWRNTYCHLLTWPVTFSH